MSLRCVVCHHVTPEHSPVCWVPVREAQRTARERRRRWWWGIVVWSALGVALGLLGMSLLGWLGAWLGQR